MHKNELYITVTFLKNLPYFYASLYSTFSKKWVYSKYFQDLGIIFYPTESFDNHTLTYHILGIMKYYHCRKQGTKEKHTRN